VKFVQASLRAGSESARCPLTESFNLLLRTDNVNELFCCTAMSQQLADIVAKVADKIELMGGSISDCAA
jgi:hypothetical protein